MRRVLFLFVLCALVTVSASARAAADAMNPVAERYAHLVLALGQHDPDYVDAFYGPAEWKTQAEKEKKSLDAIGAEAAELILTLAKIPDATFAETGFRAGGAGADVEGRKTKVRRRVARSLRRRRANFSGFALRSDHCPTGGKNSQQKSELATGRVRPIDGPDWRFVVGALRDVAQAVCDSEGKTR